MNEEQLTNGSAPYIPRTQDPLFGLAAELHAATEAYEKAVQDEADAVANVTVCLTKVNGVQSKIDQAMAELRNTSPTGSAWNKS